MFDAYSGAQIPIDTMDREELFERFKKIEEDIKQIFHEIDCIYKDIERLQNTKGGLIRCHWIKEKGCYICPYCKDIVKGRDNTWKYCPKCGRDVG